MGKRKSGVERVSHFLELRPRSEKELRDFINLRLKQVDPEEKKILLEESLKANLVDDYAFADWFVKNRLQFKKYGKNKIQLELAQKGITKEIILEVINNNFPDYADEYREKLISSLRSELKKMGGLGNVTFETKAKLTRKMLIRGYSFEEIKSALAEIQADTDTIEDV